MFGKKKKHQPEVQFVNVDKSVSFKEGETLLEIALRYNLEINHSCGGMGSCGTCRVIVENGLEKLKFPNELEAEMALERGFTPDERLACQTCAVANLKIRIPKA